MSKIRSHILPSSLACMSHLWHVVHEHTASRSVLAKSQQVQPNGEHLTYAHRIISLLIIIGFRMGQIALFAFVVQQDTLLNN